MLIPLGCTIIDWTTYLQAHERLGIEPPTRSLDAVGLKTDSPASFLATTGGSGIVQNLRTAYIQKRTDLIHLVFMIESDDKILLSLQASTRLAAMNYGEITFLSGTLTTFIDSIIACSIRKHPLLSLMNALYVYLDRGGFRECLSDYTRESDKDTFTLRHRC